METALIIKHYKISIFKNKLPLNISNKVCLNEVIPVIILKNKSIKKSKS
jgi:hypothetical protein